MVRAMATYGPRLDRYSGVSGLVGSQGRSQSALRTRSRATPRASLTLTGRRHDGTVQQRRFKQRYRPPAHASHGVIIPLV